MVEERVLFLEVNQIEFNSEICLGVFDSEKEPLSEAIRIHIVL